MSEARTDTEQELERLRARVAALEAELAAQAAKTNRVVAEAQERAYWLDRWHFDLNAAMERPVGRAFRGAMRALRSLYWGPKRLLRRLRGR